MLSEIRKEVCRAGRINDEFPEDRFNQDRDVLSHNPRYKEVSEGYSEHRYLFLISAA